MCPFTHHSTGLRSPLHLSLRCLWRADGIVPSWSALLWWVPSVWDGAVGLRCAPLSPLTASWEKKDCSHIQRRAAEQLNRSRIMLGVENHRMIGVVKNHRMIGLEETLRIIKLQPCAVGWLPPSRSGCPEPHPLWLWGPPRMGHPCLSGQQCQSLIPLCAKNFLLSSNLTFPSFSLKPLLLFLSLSDYVKSQSLSCLKALFKYGNAAMRSSWSLL